MLCSEVCDFPAPHSEFHVDFFKEKLPKSLSTFNYVHLVTALVPDCLKVPDSISEQLVLDCDYYKVAGLNLKDLVDRRFLAAFVRSGKLTLLSINTRIDCDICVAITPAGLLILTVDKDTYYSLGLEGKLSQYLAKTKERYIIRVNLKEDRLFNNENLLGKLKSSLAKAGRYNVIFSWEPPEEGVCPSSAAKYFAETGYNVTLCHPSFDSNTLYSVSVPTPLADPELLENKEEISRFVEWLGIAALDITISTDENSIPDATQTYLSSYTVPEPNVYCGQVKRLRWRGLFTPGQVEKLIQELSKFFDTENKPWIAVYTQGFSDSPVVWNNEEHHYYTNGDNGYIVVFDKQNGLLCTHRCSQKQYK